MISFRRLNKKDFNMLVLWLNKEHVKAYWDHDIIHTFKSVETKYSTRILEKKIDMYIMVVNNADIGYIQSYNCDYLDAFKLKDNAIGIDLYIGEEEFLHKGYGTKVLIKYISDLFAKQKANYIVIDPDEANIAAIKSYVKVGFKHVNTSLCTGCGKHNNYYMVLQRQDFFGKN